jgi:hypothetical protein
MRDAAGLGEDIPGPGQDHLPAHLDTDLPGQDVGVLVLMAVGMDGRAQSPGRERVFHQ